MMPDCRTIKFRNSSNRRDDSFSATFGISFSGFFVDNNARRYSNVFLEFSSLELYFFFFFFGIFYFLEFFTFC